MRILMILVAGVEPSAADREPMLRLERFAESYYLLRDAGAELVLASPEGGFPWAGPDRGAAEASVPSVRRFRADRAAQDALTDTLRLDQIHPEDFDAALCIGPAGPIWRDAEAQAAGALIARLLGQGKPVAVAPSPRDLAPHGAGAGLLIAGDHARSPSHAAQALLGALTPGGPPSERRTP